MTQLATVKCTLCGAVMKAVVANAPSDAKEPIAIRCGWEDKRVCPSWVDQHKRSEPTGEPR